jgi:hypothetical protein
MGVSVTQTQVFTDYLADLAMVRKQDAEGYFPVARLASQIIDNPRAHMDALVEAGLIEVAEWASSEYAMRMPVTNAGRKCYVLVEQSQPHIHEPYVHHIRDTNTIVVGCMVEWCDELRWAPRSAVEWPKE